MIEEYESLDNLISANLKNWNIDRLGNLEKVILRVASYELSHKLEVPVTVVINEAVQLTESYCDEKAKIREWSFSRYSQSIRKRSFE